MVYTDAVEQRITKMRARCPISQRSSRWVRDMACVKHENEEKEDDPSDAILHYCIYCAFNVLDTKVWVACRYSMLLEKEFVERERKSLFATVSSSLSALRAETSETCGGAVMSEPNALQVISTQSTVRRVKTG